MPVLQAPKCIMIISGEASGDQHGARLVRAMRRRAENLFFCGVGGKFLREAGVRILVEASELSVVGFTEVFAKMAAIARGMSVVKKLLKSLRPDLLILIDFPDFNLHAAAAAKSLGIPVLYYISPQIWAWRRGRVNKIKQLIDHMAVILPFERQLYEERNVPVTFVGHPLLDKEIVANGSGKAAGVADNPVIGLLPGSRKKEVERHLPVMLAAARRLRQHDPRLRFAVSLAPTIERQLLDTIIARSGCDVAPEIVSAGVDELFEACSFAIVASGTVSLEAAIFGIPMVIIYRLSPISYWLGRALVRVAFIGLINLIAGEEVVPELIQAEASGEKIAARVAAMLDDTAGLQRLRSRLRLVRNSLGGPGASDRTAELALGMLEKN